MLSSEMRANKPEGALGDADDIIRGSQFCRSKNVVVVVVPKRCQWCRHGVPLRAAAHGREACFEPLAPTARGSKNLLRCGCTHMLWKGALKLGDSAKCAVAVAAAAAAAAAVIMVVVVVAAARKRMTISANVQVLLSGVDALSEDRLNV